MTSRQRSFCVRWMLVIAVWLMGAGVATAQFNNTPWGQFTPGGLVKYWAGELEKSREGLALAETKLADVEAQVKQGLTPTPALTSPRVEVQRWQRVVNDWTTRVTQAQLYEKLARPVEVRFRDATLADAAQVISQASGLTITVDRALQPPGRLTTSANGFPVMEILRLLAQNTRAQIAPAPDASGVVIRPVPTVELNGQKSEYPGPTPPWSPEWGELLGPPPMAIPSQPRGSFGTGGFPGVPGAGGFPGVPAAGGGFPGVPGGLENGSGFPGAAAPGGLGGVGAARPGGFPGGPAGARPAMAGLVVPSRSADAWLTLTPLGPNTFVIASRAQRTEPLPGNPDQWWTRPLILLSLYEIRDGQMRLLSTTVHDPAPMPGPGGQIPMPGVGGPGAGPMPRGAGPQGRRFGQPAAPRGSEAPARPGMPRFPQEPGAPERDAAP